MTRSLLGSQGRDGLGPFLCSLNEWRCYCSYAPMSMLLSCTRG
jgi:hypothetical protein